MADSLEFICGCIGGHIVSAGELAKIDAVRILYGDHHGWLYGWLRRKLGNNGDAADLAHDAYIRVIVSGRLPSPGQSRAYLAQIAKGLIVDLYRRRRIETAYLEALAHCPEPVTPSPEERALILETLVRIDAALERLPAKVKEVFLGSSQKTENKAR